MKPASRIRSTRFLAGSGHSRILRFLAWVFDETLLFLLFGMYTPTPLVKEFHEESLTFLGEVDRFAHVGAGFLVRSGLVGECFHGQYPDAPRRAHALAS
jgi:hypothetical protein